MSGSRGATGVIVAVVSTSISFVVLVTRIFTRTYIVHNFGPEDWVVLVSFALSVLLTALICVEVQHGQGRHYDTIEPEDLEKLTKAFWLSVPVYQGSLSLTKISILLQYQRVFVGTTMKRVIVGSIFVITIYGLWSVLSTFFMCTPVAYFWDTSIPGGHCMSRLGVWFANASLNILTDIGIFLLPMPVLNKLQLPRRQKFALMAVFGLGGFVCLTSILRLKSLYDISISKDITRDNTPAAYWSSIEANFSIIAACLPTLRKTVSRYFPRFFSAYSQTGSRRYVTNTRRTDADAAGPNRQAEADWVQGLQSHITTQRRIELDTMKTKGDSSRGSSSDDGLTLVGDAEQGRIRVMTTITTFEVSPPEPEDLTKMGSMVSTSPKPI